MSLHRPTSYSCLISEILSDVEGIAWENPERGSQKRTRTRINRLTAAPPRVSSCEWRSIPIRILPWRFEAFFAVRDHSRIRNFVPNRFPRGRRNEAVRSPRSLSGRRSRASLARYDASGPSIRPEMQRRDSRPPENISASYSRECRPQPERTMPPEFSPHSRQEDRFARSYAPSSG